MAKYPTIFTRIRSLPSNIFSRFKFFRSVMFEIRLNYYLPYYNLSFHQTFHIPDCIDIRTFRNINRRPRSILSITDLNSNWTKIIIFFFKIPWIEGVLNRALFRRALRILKTQFSSFHPPKMKKLCSSPTPLARNVRRWHAYEVLSRRRPIGFLPDTLSRRYNNSP